MRVSASDITIKVARRTGRITAINRSSVELRVHLNDCTIRAPRIQDPRPRSRPRSLTHENAQSTRTREREPTESPSPEAGNGGLTVPLPLSPPDAKPLDSATPLRPRPHTDPVVRRLAFAARGA